MHNIIKKINDRITHSIYHYTNNEGFKGIISSKEIWMTNALFVNDKSELRMSLEGGIFQNIDFENHEFDLLKNESQRSKSKDIEDYYLASFSEDDNSLYQFRVYGNYCIGFDPKKLQKYKFDLYKCVYEQEEIKDWFIKKDKMSEWKNDCFNNERGSSYKRTAFYHTQFAGWAKSKNKHYKFEKEIRSLVVSNSSWDSGFGYDYCPELFCDQPTIYFRDDKFFNIPVPYVKFYIPKNPKSFKELEQMVEGKSRIETKQIIRKMEEDQEKELLPINKVRIGPMPNQEEVVSATKIFLLENGYDKVVVEPSDIPFRGN